MYTKLFLPPEFRQLIAKNESEIFRKDAYAKIINHVARKYALNDVFPVNNDCYEQFEIGLDMPHRL